jgi:hypothetical protein
MPNDPRPISGAPKRLEDRSSQSAAYGNAANSNDSGGQAVLVYRRPPPRRDFTFRHRPQIKASLLVKHGYQPRR